MSIKAIDTQSLLLNTMSQLRNEASISPADYASDYAGDYGNSKPVSFTRVIDMALTQVSSAQHHASGLMAAVETGASDDLVGAMVASQKAGLGFSALVQVRNRLVSGFDEIMRMPV